VQATVDDGYLGEAEHAPAEPRVQWIRAPLPMCCDGLQTRAIVRPRRSAGRVGSQGISRPSFQVHALSGSGCLAMTASLCTSRFCGARPLMR